MRALIGDVALICTAGGLMAGVAVMLRTHAFPLALKVALDFWTAAGLLRLSQSGTWRAIAVAAATVALRQLIGFGLRHSAGGTSVPRMRRPVARQLMRRSSAP